MKINIESLKSKIDNYAKSDVGKEKIKQKRIEAFDKGETFGKSNKYEITFASLDDYKILGHLFMLALDSTIKLDPRSSSALKKISSDLVDNNKYTVIKPLKYNDDSYRLNVIFNKDNLKRKSLLKEDGFGGQYYTGEGINNILALFNNGMDISEKKRGELYDNSYLGYTGLGAPFGLWETHGINVRGTTHRDPLLFMQNTAKHFLSENKEKYNLKSTKISDDYIKE